MSNENGKVKIDFNLEMIPPGDLKPHPRNYQTHPDDEVEHLVESIREHGFYKNVVIARDGTILAGHGVVLASIKLGLIAIPVIRLGIESDNPRALKLLAGDNEIRHLAEVDDRALTEMLKEIKEFDPAGLLGTGFDEAMLANLVFVTRPASEITGFDSAAEWVGLPEYSPNPKPLQIIVSFKSQRDLKKFSKLLGVQTLDGVKSMWWPISDKDDPSSLKFTK